MFEWQLFLRALREPFKRFPLHAVHRPFVHRDGSHLFIERDGIFVPVQAPPVKPAAVLYAETAGRAIAVCKFKRRRPVQCSMHTEMTAGTNMDVK
jgi:hypothetical protein